MAKNVLEIKKITVIVQSCWREGSDIIANIGIDNSEEIRYCKVRIAPGFVISYMGSPKTSAEKMPFEEYDKLLKDKDNFQAIMQLLTRLLGDEDIYIK